jgi:hypothetical protein
MSLYIILEALIGGVDFKIWSSLIVINE